MYLFGTLTRREQRLIVILTTANLLIMGLLYAGTRSYRYQTESSRTGTNLVVSDSGTAGPSVTTHQLPSD